MFEDYGFVLEYDDLPQDLKDQKIEEYMMFEHMDLDDEAEKEVAEQFIKCHFPLYF